MNRATTTLLLTLLLLTACASHYTYLHMQSSEAVLEAGTHQDTYVAWYRNGELLGREAAMDRDFPFYDYLQGIEGEVVDHPKLQQWRESLRALDLAVAGSGPAEAVLRSCSGVPFASPVEAALERWVQAAPGRSGALLDGIDGIEVEDSFAVELVGRAIDEAATGLTDGRLAGWARALSAMDHFEATMALVGCGAAGRQTALALLADLDEFSSSEQARIYRHAGAILVADPGSASLLVDAADELRSSDQSVELSILLRAAKSPELARQVLRQIDDRRFSDRLALFALAAPQAAKDPAAYRALVDAIEELPWSDRAKAAELVIASEGASVELVIMVLDQLDELPSSDQLSLVMKVLDSSHGEDERVRRVCRRAAENELFPDDRRKVLQRLGS